jgi:hypothetical protein
MFITLNEEIVHFKYGLKEWTYNTDEIASLGVIKRKRILFAENMIYLSAIICAYYYFFFSDSSYRYILLGLSICFLPIMFFRYRNVSEFNYYVIVSDKNYKTTEIKIKDRDKQKIMKQLEYYDKIVFERSTGMAKTCLSHAVSNA